MRAGQGHRPEPRDGDVAVRLRKFELLWERKLDSKALIAWNDDTVVLAFRGTASLANLWADLQVRWPCLRGRSAYDLSHACCLPCSLLHGSSPPG